MKAAPETNEPYDDALFLLSHISNTVRMRANSRETTTYVELGEFFISCFPCTTSRPRWYTPSTQKLLRP